MWLVFLLLPVLAKNTLASVSIQVLDTFWSNSILYGGSCQPMVRMRLPKLYKFVSHQWKCCHYRGVNLPQKTKYYWEQESYSLPVSQSSSFPTTFAQIFKNHALNPVNWDTPDGWVDKQADVTKRKVGQKCR